MNLTYRIIFVGVILLAWSCRDDEEFKIYSENLIEASWVNPTTVSDTLWQYERASALKSGDYGFSFQADGKFVERKNSGWCGTPPVTYSDFDGNWSQTDSILNISVAYWGGMADYRWKIILLDENKLVVYKVKEDFHLE